MGRDIGPKNKLARRFGINLGLKTNATKVARRLSQPPGVHGPGKRVKPATGYGRQLLEKQKAKIIYGLRERQFSKYVKEATRHEGDSSVFLMRLLENRLDNAVYRMGFADTRAQARQFVTHALFTVNGKKVDIPSFQVKLGDVVAVKENKLKKKLFENIEAKLSKAQLPSWVSVEPAGKSGKVLGEPADLDFEKIFDIKQIIEFYSAR